MTSTTFRLSPLIRITLLSLYTALTAPLPILSQVTSSPVPPALLWLGIGLGAIALYAALCERVVLDAIHRASGSIERTGLQAT